jgi:hypothetical protein
LFAFWQQGTILPCWGGGSSFGALASSLFGGGLSWFWFAETDEAIQSIMPHNMAQLCIQFARLLFKYFAIENR